MSKTKSKQFGDDGTLVDAVEVGDNYLVRTDKKSPNSVIFCNYRSVFEDSYPAKFDPTVVDLLIEQYTDPGDYVLDPMAGSGLLPLEAAKRGRAGIAQDVNIQAVKIMTEHYDRIIKTYKAPGPLKIIHGDSKKRIQVPSNSVDFIGTSPPFGLVIDESHDGYSDEKEAIENVETYEEWRSGLFGILQECFRVLKPEKLMVVEIRPRSKDGHSYPLWHWIHEDCEKIGFEYFSEYIEVNSTYKKWSFGSRDQRKPMPNHSFLLIFSKPVDTKLI
jgi:DNA modification methylase